VLNGGRRVQNSITYKHVGYHADDVSTAGKTFSATPSRGPTFRDGRHRGRYRQQLITTAMAVTHTRSSWKYSSEPRNLDTGDKFHVTANWATFGVRRANRKAKGFITPGKEKRKRGWGQDERVVGKGGVERDLLRPGWLVTYSGLAAVTLD